MANVFEKIWDFLKHIVTRPGLADFLKKYETQAIAIIENLSSVHNGEEFHLWYEEAFNQAKTDFNEVKGTWIAILINLAYESFKAKQSQQ